MPPQPGTETILVVDDEIAVLSITHAMLSRYGYAVITAQSGKEALRTLEVWREMPIHLALIDLVMPDMNGVELAKRIRAVRPKTPLLFFSAYSEQELLRPPYARGVPFIAKPFTSLQLMQKIRETLDEPKAAAADAE